jgi:predicted esterase
MPPGKPDAGSAASDPHGGQPVLRAGRPIAEARAAMVLLHGRGAGAADILGLAREQHHEGFAYLAPEAAGRTWYPYSFLSPLERNEPWLSSALACVGRVVEHVEEEGVPLSRVILAGFSQGACLAAEFAARHPARYGGLLAFTGGLIGPPGHPRAATGDLAGTPVYLAAGDPDPHVPWERMEETAAALSGMGAAVRLRRFPGLSHTISREEIEEARELVTAVAAADGP